MNMKIKKGTHSKSIKGSTIEVNNVRYQDAITSIKSAIDSLGELAISGDTLARESIANLSVILFDLQ